MGLTIDLESLFKPDPQGDTIYAIMKHYQPIYEAHHKNVDAMQWAYQCGQYDECEQICLEDIQLAVSFREGLLLSGVADGRMPVLPVYHSFARLAILYEKQGRYSEAADICRKAIKLGFVKDGSKGMEHRLSRLVKKINQ